jgi:hypothetical protein
MKTGKLGKIEDFGIDYNPEIALLVVLGGVNDVTRFVSCR